VLSEENFKAWLEVPAYIRKDIQLQPIAPSPSQEIIRYKLDDAKDTDAKEEGT
jgi:hypothetical protein